MNNFYIRKIYNTYYYFKLSKRTRTLMKMQCDEIKVRPDNFDKINQAELMR